MTVSWKTTFTPRYIILLLTLWQFFSVLLMAIGVWPAWIVYANLAASVFFILSADSFHGLLFAIVSIPFYVVLPNDRFETLSTWRIVFAVLFGVWFLREFKKRNLKNIRLLPWDRSLGVFVAVALLSLVVAKFKAEGLKQILFWTNVYLLYVVLVNVVKTKQQVLDVLKAAGISLVIIGTIGYVQLFATFFTSFEVFWVYWASFVSKLYYGQSLASVLLYSNSWFSYTGGTDLRMFSIMPDSHSFALLMVFGINCLMPLTYLYGKKMKSLVWSGIRFGGLAIILSGTRAVWVGLLAPLLVTLGAYVGSFARPMTKKAFWPLVIILLLFGASPFINQGLRYVRVSGKFEENFIERAQTIYKLDESSNQGRIKIWEESLLFYARHPWGTGVGNFITIAPENTGAGSYQDAAQKVNTRYNLPEEYVTAHSLYLQILVEMTVVGLAVAAWFLWEYFYAVWRFVRSHAGENDWLTFFVYHSSLTLLWVFAAAVFDVTLYNDKVLMYFFITLGLSGVVMHYYQELKDSAVEK